jgi:hypothetical protein
MKKNYYLVVVLNLLVSFQVNAQQIGNGTATEVASINTILPSGFYMTSGAQPNYPCEIPAWPWKHLFNLNNGDVCSFQISSPFTHDDHAFFRKVVYNSTNPNCDNQWYEFATRGYNAFKGNQKINGSLTLVNSTYEGYSILLRNEKKTQPGQALEWQILNMTAHHGDALRFIACDQETCNWRFTIMDNGNVGIGIHRPTNKLEVDGTIKAKEIKVETGWADHVFSKDYNLPTLKEVKFHIESHKHLPDIPTEAEVKVSGINLGEMQVKLLQKVEELTLYLIQQQETIDELKNEIKTLKSNK